MIGILSKIVKYNTVNVIGVFRTESGDRYYCLTVKKNANSLDVLATAVYNTIDELLEKTAKKYPLIVSFDGKGVLNKKIDLKNEGDAVWKKNIEYNTIYFVSYTTPDIEIMSFCRRQPVDDILALLTQKGFNVIDFFVGPLLSFLLHPVVKADTVFSNGSVLEITGGQLTNVSKNNDAPQLQYTFGQTKLSAYHLPLYGNAVCFFLQPKEILKSGTETLNQEEAVYKKAFNYLGIAMLVLFFSALLGSYIAIQYFSAENVALNQKNIYSSQTYRQIQELEKQKEHKLKILSKTGQFSNKFLSYYIYELSKSIPVQIQLNTLDVFPVTKEIKENTQVEFASNVLTISGTTLRESSFNEWMNNLKKMGWIKSFEITSFKKDKKGVQQFELKILIADV